MEENLYRRTEYIMKSKNFSLYPGFKTFHWFGDTTFTILIP